MSGRRSNGSLRLALALLAGAWSLVLAGGCAATADPAPRPLELARELVREVPADRTTYQHKPTVVRWAGAGEPAACRADCSGLMNELFKRAWAIDDERLSAWLGRDRPLAIDYYRAISSSKGFARIEQLSGAAPGDLIAVQYEPGSGNTGHVMMIDRPAERALASPPLVEGTTQWRVRVIDASSTGHGPGDTRYEGDRKVRTGLGEGEFRLYVDGAGRIAGHTFTTAPDAPFRPQVARPVVIGRAVGPVAGRPRRGPRRTHRRRHHRGERALTGW